MNYDVIIIGAGPGGIFAAYELMKEMPDCSHSPIFPTDFPVQNLKYLKSFHPLHKVLQSFLIPDHPISSVPIHIPDAPLHPSHKKV